MQELKPEEYARVVFERFGGKKKFFQIQKQRHQAIVEAWHQDADQIGRVVRAHLFVEHYLTAFLDAENTGLAPIDSARLSFAQKVSLLRNDHPSVGGLRPGIRRLNRIRNRIAHTLKADVRHEDADLFRGIQMFAAMQRAGGYESELSGSPLEVLESFAKFAGMTLAAASSPDAHLWTKEVTSEELAALGSREGQ